MGHFDEAIDRAKETRLKNDRNPALHFFPAPGRTRPDDRGRPGSDILLSRYGCHLVAPSGDHFKPEIAAAKDDFITKARESELIRTAPADPVRAWSSRRAVNHCEHQLAVGAQSGYGPGRSTPSRPSRSRS
jgi:hypothetical protein